MPLSRIILRNFPHPPCLQPVHSLRVQRFYKQKDGEAAAQARLRGNKLFLNKQDKQALQAYSQAVMQASHVDGGESCRHHMWTGVSHAGVTCGRR